MLKNRLLYGTIAAATLLTAACSDSKVPVGPTDQTGNQPDLSRAAQGAPDDPVALGRAVPGFGGVFLDDQGTPTVYLQDVGRRSAAEQALAPWLRGHGMNGAQMRLLHADFAWSDLEAWHAKGSPEALAVRGAVFTTADGASNRIRIGIERGSGAGGQIRSALARLGIPDAAVTVEETDPIIQLATLQNQVRPVIAGLQINFPGFLCTLGFNATATQAPGSPAGFVTASHCTNTQGGVESTPYWQPLQSVAPTQIATEILDPVYTSGGTGCPPGRRCRRSDASFAKYINGTANTLGSIARTSSTNKRNLTIVGSYAITADASSSPNFTIGAVVNKVGRTTGWSQGKVTASCAAVNVSGSDITQLCQTVVAATVGAGDSGSDVFSITSGTSVTLDGVLWGGSSNGKTFVFSPLFNVEQELGNLTTH